MTADQTHRITLEPVGDGDFDDMATLRERAMRPSLERLGRFDPQRSRNRLRAGFSPEDMRWICSNAVRVGFYSLRREERAWRLEHLYLHPDAQGMGLGSRILKALIARIQDSGLPLRVTALRGSASNAFYLRHGFVQTGESAWDIEYQRPADSTQ